MELGYDNAASVAGTSYSTPAYNGNIAGTIWKSAGDGRRTAESVLELEAGQVYELMDYLADTRKQLLQYQGEATDVLFIQHHDVTNFYGVASVILEHLRRINHKVKNLDQVRASVITHWVQVYDLRKAQYLAGHGTSVRRNPTNSRCSMSCRRT